MSIHKKRRKKHEIVNDDDNINLFLIITTFSSLSIYVAYKWVLNIWRKESFIAIFVYNDPFILKLSIKTPYLYE